MILVVGATGRLGGRITRGLLAQGKAVRILDRGNPLTAELARQGMANTAQSLVEAGAQAVYGDLKERASLEAALVGVDTVITTANAAQRGGEDSFESVDLKGTGNLIAAAQAAGVKRFLFTSAAGANPQHPVPLFAYKGINELALEQSGMTYIILQPTIFMEVWIGMIVGIPLMTQQTILLKGNGDHHHNFISEADVAAFTLAALDNPRAFNQRLVIGGPASYSWTEVVETAGKVVGAPLPVSYIPLDGPVPYLPPGVGDLFAGMETYESYVDMSELAPAYGVKLTGLEEFLRGMLGR